MQERRHSSRELVEKLVAERTEMLVLYCRIAGLDPFDKKASHAPGQELLQEFLQVLVDYLAAGHFSLYDRITSGTERRQGVVELARDLYPRIAETTQAALDFNDKYDGRKLELTEGFHADLSRLGELLAGRIAIEDQILSRLVR